MPGTQKELKRNRSSSELDSKELNANQQEKSLPDILRRSVLEGEGGEEFNGREASQAHELDILRDSVQRHQETSQWTKDLTSTKQATEISENDPEATATSRFTDALDRSLFQRGAEISEKNGPEGAETRKEATTSSKPQKFREVLSHLFYMADSQTAFLVDRLAQEEVGAVGGEVGGNLAGGNFAGGNFAGGNLSVYATDMQMQARASQQANMGNVEGF